ncbi:MAG TPA: Gfo/Idh/MocA family oxidoreductase [Candidatus Limnocylindrales bacterium]|nr:Gfo/Idh/MocA family oxidoreductase [Candidatus Limnocylindrales bacterium]
MRVGVVGAGLIAQVMHLHYLRELVDRYEVVALCDIVPGNAAAVAARFGIDGVFSDWREMLAEPLDAVLVLTSGDHAPLAIGAARRGIHAFVEKPMCYSTTEGLTMVQAARDAGTTLMVGYQKRYDPAYLRFRDELAAVEDARLLQVTTLESPYWPYVDHYSTIPPRPPSAEQREAMRAVADAAIRQGIGDAEALARHVYEGVLLASLVHEINALRGLLGEPDVLEHASLRPGSLSLLMRFGALPVTLDRVDLPGMTRYRMEFALHGPTRRTTLSFPSPFLRNEPTTIRIEEGAPGTTRSSVREEITSYESGFKRELIAFHEAITTGAPMETPGSDAVRDIALCQAIIAAHATGAPVERPTEMR